MVVNLEGKKTTPLVSAPSLNDTGIVTFSSHPRKIIGSIMGKRKPSLTDRADRHGRGPGFDRLWLYGVHAVTAALANPERRWHRLLVTAGAGREIRRSLAGTARGDSVLPATEVVPRDRIDRVLPPGAVHQGIALEVEPLPGTGLEAVCRAAADLAGAVMIVLDQVTDPRNVGAVLRSAAAFGACAVIVPDRRSPKPTGALAKAASGALETVPLVRATNLARALHTLKGAGFWCVGLDAQAAETLAGARLSGKIALVLGAEGKGLRRLTRESCDLLVRVPTADAFASLNVANTAAVALYELARGG